MNIHMIGIGGAGMSGIAEVLARRGHSVTGSDLKESPYTRRLREEGITVYIGHAPDQVGDADRVVISTAIPTTNPELLQARRRSIPVIPRAAALAWILQGSRSVAVAGTHGKTTTTSMTAHVLEALGESPTALIGGELNDIGSNVAFGRSDLVVAEADESDRSFLYLRPQAAVVTNIEFDTRTSTLPSTMSWRPSVNSSTLCPRTATWSSVLKTLTAPWWPPRLRAP